VWGLFAALLPTTMRSLVGTWASLISSFAQ
jgi:hypothetical protein